MYSFLTFPFYIGPLFWSMRKGIYNPSTIFFVYTFFGCWLLGSLLETNLASTSIIIAPWAICFEDIPWLTMAAINFVVFSSYTFFRKKKANLLNYNKNILIPSNKKIYQYITIFFIAICVEIFITLYLHQGTENWLRSAFGRTIINDSRINFIFPLTLGVNVISCVILALLLGKTRPRKTYYIFTIILIAQLLYLILSGGRSMFFLLIISLVIIKFKRPSFIRYIQGGLLALLFVGLSGYTVFERYKTQNAFAQFEANALTIIESSYTGLPFIDHIALSQLYAARRGHDYGANYLNALTVFVPRSIWPEKPIQLSRKMRKEFFGDTDGGIPPGLFGESFIAFGYFGLTAVAIILGLIIAKTENFSTNSHSNHINRLRTAIFSTLIGFVLVRGGVDIGVYRVGLIIAIYIIIEKSIIKFEKENFHAPVA